MPLMKLLMEATKTALTMGLLIWAPHVWLLVSRAYDSQSVATAERETM
jgi:hypothetical protein